MMNHQPIILDTLEEIRDEQAQVADTSFSKDGDEKVRSVRLFDSQ